MDEPMKIIAHIENDYTEKFGIPRQSGLIKEFQSRIVFEPEFRVPEAIRGISDYTHLWLIWEFSEALKKQKSGAARSWSPTVRPPRLGGNIHMGVFATRSPFRPNPIGLSCVKLVDVQIDPVLGPVLYVAGADLMNGTPIYDIKPYLPYADCCPEASGGFTDAVQRKTLTVICPEECLAKLPEKSRTALPAILAQDPRPSYQEDPDRIYGFTYAEHEVKFKVEKDILTVISIE